jgi:hypothetical protein
MEGRDEPPELRGIIPNTFHYVFDTIAQQSACRLLALVHVAHACAPA